MSYELRQPYTEQQRMNFIVEYNHKQDLQIAQTDDAVYALEPWETLENGVVVDNREAWEAEQALKEKERIAKLKLTKREVFLGLYQAKGVTPDQIKAQITDPAALIEFEYANDYYRGNPLIDIVGARLGITPEQLDKFFETNDYTYLIPEPVVDNSDETTEEESVVEDVTEGEDVNNSEE